MCAGCPGGSTIIGAVSNALLGRLVHGLPVQVAVDLPRVVSRNTVRTDPLRTQIRPHLQKSYYRTRVDDSMFDCIHSIDSRSSVCRHTACTHTELTYYYVVAG